MAADPTPLGDAGSADPRADVVSDEQLARSIDRMEREAEYCRADARLGLEAGDPEPYERIAAALRELQRLRSDRTLAPAQPVTGAPGTSTPAQREAFIARGNVMAPAQPDAQTDAFWAGYRTWPAVEGNDTRAARVLAHWLKPIDRGAADRLPPIAQPDAAAGNVPPLSDEEAWIQATARSIDVAVADNDQWGIGTIEGILRRALARVSPAPQPVPPQGAPEASVDLEKLAAEVVNQFNPIAGDIVLRDLVLAALQRARETPQPVPKSGLGHKGHPPNEGRVYETVTAEPKKDPDAAAGDLQTLMGEIEGFQHTCDWLGGVPVGAPPCRACASRRGPT